MPAHGSLPVHIMDFLNVETFLQNPAAVLRTLFKLFVRPFELNFNIDVIPYIWILKLIFFSGLKFVLNIQRDPEETCCRSFSLIVVAQCEFSKIHLHYFLLSFNQMLFLLFMDHFNWFFQEGLF